MARKAHNEAIFRDANEEIEAVRDQLTEVQGKTPYLCECEDRDCREIVRLDVGEYEAIRAHPTRFLIARGHPSSGGPVVEDHGAYVVVDKEGIARQIAVETDPRSASGQP